MIWVAVGLLIVLALLPVAWTSRRGVRARGRKEAALALHRAQLLELERDLAERRIGSEDYRTARLEVQRRLLAAADSEDPAARPASSAMLWGCLALVPFATFALYLVAGRPDLSQPVQTRPSSEAAADLQLIEQLRRVLAQMDPHSPQALQGNVLLARAEEGRGDDPAAAAAWKAALVAHFDPEIAIHAADALTRVGGQITPEAATLYRRALAAAPDAPWRSMLEQRLAGMK